MQQNIECFALIIPGEAQINDLYLVDKSKSDYN